MIFVKMKILQFLLRLFLTVIPFTAPAQFKSAMVGVNGLTCSACSKTVELAIRKLAFVQDVDMNLEQTEGKIVFRENSEVDLEKVANAVKDAGFSVRYLNALYHFQSGVPDGNCVVDGNKVFQFSDKTKVKDTGEVNLLLLGAPFQPRKEYLSMKSSIVPLCAVAEKKLYFVK